jgi:hypothetical protein
MAHQFKEIAVRSVHLLVVTVGIMILARPGFAQAVSVRTITVPEADVRSFEGEKYYATSKLRKGDKVIVLGLSDNPDWLKIKPPRGSFSWINERFVKRDSKHIGHVVTDEHAPAPLKPGSAISDKTPDVQKWSLKNGTAVVILDEAFHIDGEAWLPIDVAPEEVRFIPASSVAGSLVEKLPAEYVTLPKQTIQLADQNFQAKNLPAARNLYLKVVHEAPDYEDRIHCQRQLDEISKLTIPQSGTGYPPGNPSSVALGPTVTAMPAVMTTTKYANQPQPLSPSPSLHAAKSPEWSQWGKLQPTGYSFQGRPMYRLLDGKGNTLTYAITPPNLTLETYVGRLVCLWGTKDYRSDEYLRAYYVNVTYIALPPKN